MNLIPEAPQQDRDLKKIQGRYSPVSILLITIGGIALAEIIAMIVIYFFRYLPYYQQVLLDAAIMTVIIFPLLYFLSFRPLLLHIRQRHRVEWILQTRLRLIQFANTHSLKELLQFTLDEIEALTGGTIGFFHFLDPDQNTLRLQAWSANTVQTMCSVTSPAEHYPLEQAGVWADCVRQRRPVIHNDYSSLSNRKGMPDGHARVIREMSVPVMRDEKIVAVLGVGNKPQDFTAGDVELVSTLTDFAWDIVQQKQAEDALRASEEKFRTLVDWTYDWELWVDPEGQIIYMSPSCERITGYSSDEFTADSDLLIRIVHPEDQMAYREHHDLVHDETVGTMNMAYRIITRDGAERWIEHICRPLFGAGKRYLGRRVSNRDITERKRIEAEILERNRKEKSLIQMLHTMQLDIARDLHDTIGQNIGYLRMKLDYLAEKNLPSTPDAMKAEFEQMSQVATESYDLVRGTLAILQSQGPDDLLQLFRRYATRVVERSGFDIEFNSLGTAGILSAHQMRQLFYIFREALSNIEKYSEASHARVEMCWEPSTLILSIADNGKGFDPSQPLAQGGHYGLKFMRERSELMNGSFQMKTELGSGTEIMICVPLQTGSLSHDHLPIG